jgi:hypothetical protein
VELSYNKVKDVHADTLLGAVMAGTGAAGRVGDCIFAADPCDGVYVAQVAEVTKHAALSNPPNNVTSSPTDGRVGVDKYEGKDAFTTILEVNTQVESTAPVKVNRRVQGKEEPSSPARLPLSVAESKVINNEDPVDENLTPSNFGAVTLDDTLAYTSTITN